MQIDDLFLATEEPFVTTNTYRMTPADSQALATFAANVPSLPTGSSFRVRAFLSCLRRLLYCGAAHCSSSAAASLCA